MLDSVIVAGKKTVAQELLSVPLSEKRSGMTDDVNKLLFLKPGINRIPEAGSSLLIRGEGPFDNEFRIFDVPMFAPSHFTNSSFCDHSATMIATVKDLQVVSDAVGGRYAGASASVIRINPGISRFGRKDLIPRPELSANFGMLNQDFSLSFPFRNGADVYQLSFTNTDWYRIKWLNTDRSGHDYVNDSNAIGYAWPKSYGDIVFNGEQKTKNVIMQEYGLYASDEYNSSLRGDELFVPWGVGAVSVEDTLPNGILKASAGGSRQWYFEGKRMGFFAPLLSVERTNASGRIEVDKIRFGRFLLDGSFQAQRLDWQADQRMAWYHDDFGNLAWTSPLYSQHGRETEATLHFGARRDFGRMSLGGNVLFGAVFPAKASYIDPGLWTKFSWNSSSIGLFTGITTSRPDIRGLPDRQYRSSLEKTYSVSVAGSAQPASWCRIESDAFVKWKDKCPARSMRTDNLLWDPSLESPLFARGVNLDLTLGFWKNLSLTVLQDAVWADRMYPAGRVIYEWNIPWTNKSILKYDIISDKLQFFLVSVVSAGLPYRNLVWKNSWPTFSDDISRVENYHRIDLKIQYSQPVESHRYLTRYDTYVELLNVFDAFEGLRGISENFSEWSNVREYFWDSDLKKNRVVLEHFTINFGLRFGLRF
jgi:hypothetical protein